MTLTISTLISFVAFSIYSVLLGILVSRGIRSHLHRTFAFYLASMVLWSFGSLALFSNLGLGSTVFWNRFMLIGYLGMPVAFFVFVQAFLHRYHRSMTYLGYIVYAAILVANAFGLIIQSAYLSNGELHNQYGLALYLSAATWTIFIGYSAFSMLQEYRRTKDSLYRNRIRYLLVVILTIFAGSVTNATPLRFFPVDILFNVFSALLMSYAIQRHQLLDVSVVIRKGLLYSIPTVLISASYFLIISLSVSFFGSFSGFHIFLLSLFVAILTALITQPVRDKVQFWIDRLFFREKYDTALMLQRISRTAASVLDIQQLTLMLLTEVASTLHLKHADFFLRDEDTGDFYLTSQVGLSLAPTLKFKASHPVVKILSERENALTYREIELMPQSKGLWEAEEEDLKRIGAELFIPLKIQGKLVGIFVVGPKLSEETYTPEDEGILTTLAIQTTVAIENARLYSAEQSRREELDALYNLTRRYITTDDVDGVLISTVRHVVENVHVTFARILILEEGCNFRCRASYPIRILDQDLGAGTLETSPALCEYQRAMSQGQTLVLDQTDKNLTDEDRRALHFDLVNSLCIAPLKIQDSISGVLVLGEARTSSREPFDLNKLRLITAFADQAVSALQRAYLYEQMEKSFVQTVLALANAMDARDTYTNDHSQRMAALAEAACIELNLDEELTKAIRLAAVLHDIGKIGVPDEILRKPGPLTEEEWAIMRRHPDTGAMIVAPVKKLANVAPIIRTHHERFDGNGYPSHLMGEQIPLGARLIAVIDSYTAMTDDRPYRRPYSHAEAIAELKRCSGTQFDPQMVETFLRVIERGPVTLTKRSGATSATPGRRVGGSSGTAPTKPVNRRPQTPNSSRD